MKEKNLSRGIHYPGNRIRLLQNGDEIFPAMLESIRGAKQSIEFVTYVFWRSDIATVFAEALSERARAGVHVRLLLDSVGAASIKARTIWRLERSGVRVAWFRTGHLPHISKFNNRTHRKILIVDGNTGFTGGVGIADEWTGHAQDADHWRDIHCRIQGPACAGLLAGFATEWLEATGEPLEYPVPKAFARGTDIGVHISTAGRRPTAAELFYMDLINRANSRLWIATAYFVPGKPYVHALIAAARRGADVRVLTNGALTNHKITRRAGHASYAALLSAGVKIYEYEPTVIHSKLVTVDSAFATLGSINFDDRSLVLNDELNISFTNPKIIKTLDLMYLEDLKNALHIRSSEWQKRALRKRVVEAGSRVFKKQL